MSNVLYEKFIERNKDRFEVRQSDRKPYWIELVHRSRGVIISFNPANNDFEISLYKSRQNEIEQLLSSYNEIHRIPPTDTLDENIIHRIYNFLPTNTQLTISSELLNKVADLFL